VLDRPRHEDLIAEIREAGARIRLIPDGRHHGQPLGGGQRHRRPPLHRPGGSTEGVITAAALECLGAEIQARMAPRDEADRRKMADFGMSRPDRVLSTRDLAPGPLYVIATGVTDGGLLKASAISATGRERTRS
jgi:fructose-1,6-bisphosphatase II